MGDLHGIDKLSPHQRLRLHASYGWLVDLMVTLAG